MYFPNFFQKIAPRIWAGLSLIIGLAALGPAGCGSDDPTPLAPRQDRYLHVATNGSPTNDGTADSPLRVPSTALRRAFLEGYQGVRLAAGVYTNYFSDNGLRLYGGIDVIGGCDPDTWLPVPGQYSQLDATDWPLRALGIRTPTLVRGLDLRGPPTHYGKSSTALFLDGCSPELQFEYCRFASEAGRTLDQPGDNGSLPAEAVGPEAGGPGSCDAEAIASGGLYGYDGCRGGLGGAGGRPGQAGQAGLMGCGAYGQEGAPGGEPGLDGTDGRDGTDGLDGDHAELRTELGTLYDYRLLPFRSNTGRIGGSGLGGGGGSGGGGSATGSTTGTGNGGGGGGTGGYGGGGGQGGDNGGHSIPVICTNSNSVFRHCLFVAARGGDGGDGGDGAPGTSGTPGAPGAEACPSEVGRGGNGGSGGHGGCGGGGVGGTGGVSYGMLVLGSVQPQTDKACVFSAAAPSVSGVGGLHGNGLSRAPDGRPGESLGQKIIRLPAGLVAVDGPDPASRR